VGSKVLDGLSLDFTITNKGRCERIANPFADS
jgi:hypothetical protein